MNWASPTSLNQLMHLAFAFIFYSLISACVEVYPNRITMATSGLPSLF